MVMLKSGAGWVLASLALILSPAVVVFAAPFGYGICRDLVATAWLAPLALALAATIAFNAMRRRTAQAA